MEVVASGMAVASLSIQLTQSISTIKTFIRDVKGASKELERLAERLDRLNALLHDIREIMERQTSLQAQHFPAPSNTIFSCLKSCETCLQSLQNFVEKYKPSSGNVSAMAKLKDDIKFGFKTKDIADCEHRIQRDIDSLSTALVLNHTSILIAVLPAMSQMPQVRAGMFTPSHQSVALSRSTPNSEPYDALLVSRHEKHNIIRTRQVQVSSFLEWAGIYWQKSEQYVRHEENKRRKDEDTTRQVVSQTHNIFLTWRVLRFGVQWSGMPASLSMYPIVMENLFNLHEDFFRDSSILEIQKAFVSGTIHPFTRDVDGYSLLHVAASCARPDVCHLLLQHGLKSDYARYGPDSPLVLAVDFGIENPSEGSIDTLRLLLHDCHAVHDFEGNDYLSWWPIFTSKSLYLVEWLWIDAAAVLVSSELLCFRWMLVRCLLQGYWFEDGVLQEEITERLLRMITAEMLQHYTWGEFPLVKHLFMGLSSLSSQAIGGTFLNLLARLNLDVETCMSMELENLKHLAWDGCWRKIVFEPREDHGWILRWEWILDPHQPGYLLVSEYIGLGPDCWFEDNVWPFSKDWPFSEDYPSMWNYEAVCNHAKKAELRFNRRMAAKARKERARLGQKLAKIRMPGTWVW